jgi:hypothetical protein
MIARLKPECGRAGKPVSAAVSIALAEGSAANPTAPLAANSAMVTIARNEVFGWRDKFDIQKTSFALCDHQDLDSIDRVTIGLRKHARVRKRRRREYAKIQEQDRGDNRAVTIERSVTTPGRSKSGPVEMRG